MAPPWSIESGEKIAELTQDYRDPGDEWQQYVMAVPKTEGKITLYFVCSASYCFSGITMY